MRRSRQQLTASECADVLRRATCGVLALLSPTGYPYGVPLNHCYVSGESCGRLLFHCALTGHKMEALACGTRASFTVIDQDRVVEPRFTTAYRSVIAFGRVTVLSGEPERLAALRTLCRALCPTQGEEAVEAEIAGAVSRVAVLQMDIGHLSGKQGRELLNAR